jgi:transposase
MFTIRMSRTAAAIVLSSEKWATIDMWARGKRFSVRLVQRAQIIQMAADRIMNQDIAVKLETTRSTVQPWRDRFLALRLAGLEKDAPRPGRLPKIPAEKMAVVGEATLHGKSSNATHWSTRTIAATQGISEKTVRRPSRNIWKITIRILGYLYGLRLRKRF